MRKLPAGISPNGCVRSYRLRASISCVIQTHIHALPHQYLEKSRNTFLIWLTGINNKCRGFVIFANQILRCELSRILEISLAKLRSDFEKRTRCRHFDSCDILRTPSSAFPCFGKACRSFQRVLKSARRSLFLIVARALLRSVTSDSRLRLRTKFRSNCGNKAQNEIRRATRCQKSYLSQRRFRRFAARSAAIL